MLQARKLIIENEATFSGDYPLLIKGLFDSVYNGNYSLTDAQKKMWLAAIGEFLYRSAFVLDQDINFYCLMLNLADISS